MARFSYSQTRSCTSGSRALDRGALAEAAALRVDDAVLDPQPHPARVAHRGARRGGADGEGAPRVEELRRAATPSQLRVASTARPAPAANASPSAPFQAPSSTSTRLAVRSRQLARHTSVQPPWKATAPRRRSTSSTPSARSSASTNSSSPRAQVATRCSVMAVDGTARERCRGPFAIGFAEPAPEWAPGRTTAARPARGRARRERRRGSPIPVQCRAEARRCKSVTSCGTQRTLSGLWSPSCDSRCRRCGTGSSSCSSAACWERRLSGRGGTRSRP